jgi:hypothetical protein
MSEIIAVGDVLAHTIDVNEHRPAWHAPRAAQRAEQVVLEL